MDKNVEKQLNAVIDGTFTGKMTYLVLIQTQQVMLKKKVEINFLLTQLQN